MTDTSNNNSHLETIDYKPPIGGAVGATSHSTTTTPNPSNLEEKKTDDFLSSREEPHDDHDREDDEEEAKFDLYHEEAEWDEGGKSHCGYSETVHSTLMSVGESVHSLVGEPSPRIEKELKAVGNWFQEASYAARDLFRGPTEGEESSGMKEDALDAVKTLLRGGSKNDDKNKNGDDYDRESQVLDESEEVTASMAGDHSANHSAAPGMTTTSGTAVAAN